MTASQPPRAAPSATQLGINWLATLPQHRSHGLGRAVMCAALGFCAHRPAVLVATVAGEPLSSALDSGP